MLALDILQYTHKLVLSRLAFYPCPMFDTLPNVVDVHAHR